MVPLLRRLRRFEAFRRTSHRRSSNSLSHRTGCSYHYYSSYHCSTLQHLQATLVTYDLTGTDDHTLKLGTADAPATARPTATTAALTPRLRS